MCYSFFLLVGWWFVEITSTPNKKNNYNFLFVVESIIEKLGVVTMDVEI